MRKKGSESFSGVSTHSHTYRKPDGYKNKRVLVIGAGSSGTDISIFVGQVASKVFLSYRSKAPKSAENVTLKPEVDRFTEKTVIFKDGTEENIDNIIYCTGYKYFFPFLPKESGITVENNWVKYVHKHIVNVNHPTMGFIGVTFNVCPIPTIGIQARYYLSLFKNRMLGSKEIMMREVQEAAKKREEIGWPDSNAHKIGERKIGPYFDELAEAARIEKMKPVIAKLFDYVHSTRCDRTKNYKILNADKFILLE